MVRVQKSDLKKASDHALLKEMGFKIVGNYKVCIDDDESRVFDLSAIRMEVSAIIYHIANCSYTSGYKKGEKDLKNNFKKLLDI